MTSTKLRAAIGLAAISSLIVACSDIDQPRVEERQLGSLVIEGDPVSETEVDAIARMIFFKARSGSIIGSVEMRKDECILSQITDTTTFEPEGQFRAGEKLTLKVGGTDHDMNWNSFNARYDTDLQSPFRYTTGTTAQVLVPGSDDYPAGNVSVTLAEPLFAQPVSMGSGNQPMTVTWNGSSSNTSAVLLALSYASSPTVGYPDFQIVCQLVDDGVTVIPASSLTAFRSSPIGHRSLTLTRLRTNEVTLANNALLHINSQIQITVPLQ